MHPAADSGRGFRVQAALQAAQLQVRAVRADELGFALDNGHAAAVGQIGQAAAVPAQAGRQRVHVPQGQGQRAAQLGPQQGNVARHKFPAQQSQKIRPQRGIGHGEMQVLSPHRGVAHRDGRHGQKHHVHGFHTEDQARARGNPVQIVAGESLGITLQKIEGRRQQNRQHKQQRQENAQKKT